MESRITTVEKEMQAIEKLLSIMQSYQIWTSTLYHVEELIDWADRISRCVGDFKWNFWYYGEDIRKNLGVIKNHNQVFMSGL